MHFLQAFAEIPQQQCNSIILVPQIPEQHRVGQLRPPADHHSQGCYRGPAAYSERRGICRGEGDVRKLSKFTMTDAHHSPTLVEGN